MAWGDFLDVWLLHSRGSAKQGKLIPHINMENAKVFSEHVKYLSSASITEGDDICQQKPVVRPKEETDQVYTIATL